MSPDQLATLEYEALRSEERDRMNSRLQVWTLYLSLVGAFGLASVQSSSTVYLVALCPLLLACLAQHVRQSENVLRRIRKYLHQVELKADYTGYEHFHRALPAGDHHHGGHVKALRDAFLLTDALATAVVVARLWSSDLVWVAFGLIVLESIVGIVTFRWLRR